LNGLASVTYFPKSYANFYTEEYFSSARVFARLLKLGTEYSVEKRCTLADAHMRKESPGVWVSY